VAATADGGAGGQFGGGVAAAFFLLPAVSVLLFSLFPLLPLSTTFFSLCSGFVEMLVVAAWGSGLDGGRPFFLFFSAFFFSSVRLCFRFFLLLLTGLLSSVAQNGVAVVVVVKWLCWMVVAEGHCGERGAAAGNPKISPVSASFLLFFCFSSLLFGLCFLFLSPFSRLASLSVTAFSPSPKILPPSFCFFPSVSASLSFSKIPPRFVPLFPKNRSPSSLIFLSAPQIVPPWLLVPPLVFISRGGEDHLTTAMAQGKVGDGSCWQGMVSVSFFFHNACRVWLCGYGSCGIFGQVGW